MVFCFVLFCFGFFAYQQGLKKQTHNPDRLLGVVFKRTGGGVTLRKAVWNHTVIACQMFSAI